MEELYKKYIFYDNGSWCAKVKEIDLRSYQINYIVKSGFKSEDEAADAYNKGMLDFKNTMMKIREFSFSEYLDYWYENILKTYASDSYLSVSNWAIHSLIIPHIIEGKDVILSKITASYINSLLKKLSNVCVSAAPESRKIIGLSIKDAIAEGYMSVNPMPGVEQYYFNSPKLVTCTTNEIKRLLVQAKAYHSVYLDVLLGLFCGLRQGEILGLKYSDFNRKEKSVQIIRQIRSAGTSNKNNKNAINNRIIKEPKSYSSYRKISAPDIIFEELDKRKSENQYFFETNPEVSDIWKDFVSIGSKGNIRAQSTFEQALITICKRASIPRLCPHDLRHLYASILIEQGAPLELISHSLGHKSVATTLNVYAGIIKANDEIRNYVQKNLDPIYASPVKGNEVNLNGI